MNHSTISIAAMLAALVSGLAQSPAAMAQGGKQMYRCGSNYQDRPCEGAVPATAKSASASGSTAKAAAAPEAPKGSAGGTSGGAGPAAANAAGPVLTKAQQQRQIRCENFGRQLDELKERQRAAPKQAEATGVQIRSLESRMSADSC